MKLRRLFAAFLAVVLILTNSPITFADSTGTEPVQNETAVVETQPVQSEPVDSGDDQINTGDASQTAAGIAEGDVQTLSAVNTEYMLWSAGVKNTGTQLERVSNDYRANMINDAPYTDSLYSDAVDEFNKSGEEWVWFAYKVNAPEAGDYTLGLNVTNISNQRGTAGHLIPICVNGTVYTVACSGKGQSLSTTVKLAKGDNTVVVFMPMPKNAADAFTGADNQWKNYTWICVDKIIVDSNLTVSKPTVAEVEGCFYTTIKGGDETIVLANNFKDNGDTLGGVSAGNMRGDKPTIGTLANSAALIERWPFASVKVTAAKDGTYKIRVNATVNTATKSAQLGVLVDDKAYSAPFTVTSPTAMETEVYMTAGEHVVTFFLPMPMDNSGAIENAHYPWMDYQTIVFGAGLGKFAKPTIQDIRSRMRTTVSAVDTNNMLLSATIQQNTTALGRTDQATLKNDQPTIETLFLDAPGQFNKSGEEWNWFAFAVDAPEAGTYTLGVQTAGSKYAAYKIPLCVNNKVYTLTYSAKSQQVTAEVTLPKGKHVVVAFMPLPANQAAASGNEWNDYHWCDISSVTVDGLLNVSKPTVAEVEAIFAPKGISAANANYLLWSATTDAKNEGGVDILSCKDQAPVRADLPYIDSLYADAAEEFNKSGEEWNWFAYNIHVPVAGTYTLGVKTQGAKFNEFKIPLCVNDEVYTLTYTAKAQEQTVNVSLPAGKSTVVMFMPMPQNAAASQNNAWNDYPWCNVQSVTVPAGVELSKPTAAEVEACFTVTDQTISAINEEILLLSATIGKDGKLSRTDSATLKADKPTVETLFVDAAGQFNKAGEEWNWFAYKVNVRKAGTYTLGVKTAGAKFDAYRIPLCVNNEVHTLTYSAKSQQVTAEVTLPKGEHVVVMFLPMPANKAAVEGNEWNDYHWCDVESVTVDGKLTASKPTVAEVEAVFAPKVIAASNTDYILLSKPLEGYAGKAFLERGTDGARDDKPYIDTLHVDAYEQFNKSGEEWSWFALKVTVPAAGSYMLGIETAGCKYDAYKIPACVDGKVNTLSFTAKNQKVSTQLNLTAGEHVIVLFMPIPQSEAGIQNNVWNDYPWCNVKEVTLSAGIKVSKPTVAEVEAAMMPQEMNSPLWEKSALFVGDSITYSNNSWASKIGNRYRMDWTNSGVSGATISDLRTKIIRHELMLNAANDYDYVIMHGGINDAEAAVGTVSDSWNVADFDTATYAGGLETMFYYAYENFGGAKLGYIVNYATPNADTSKWKGAQDMSAYFEAGKQVCEKWGVSYIDLYAGKTADGKSYSYDILKVDKAAEHFLNNDPHEIHLSDAGYQAISPYIAKWMETLEAKTSPIPAANSGKYIDANNTGKVLSGGFKVKREYVDGTVNVGLQDRDYNGMSADLANIEILPYAKDMLGDWAFASITVKAEQAGDYRFAVEMSAKNATQMGMLVDNQVYTLKYAKANGNYMFMDQTVSLTEGTHYITFTAAMPNNDNELDGDAWNIYPWTNIAAIVVDEGLEVLEAPAVTDVTAKLSEYKPFYTRIEAEDADYVLYNNYNTPNETNAKASGGHVVGGAWNSTYEQTFEELEKWLDIKHNAYVEYAVYADEAGEYDIRVGFLAGHDPKKNENNIEVQKPYIAVVVNGTATHRVQFTKNWNQVDKAKLTVKLEKGLNIIRCTSFTTEQSFYQVKGWVNQDFLDVDTRLTPVKRVAPVKVEAESSRCYNKFTIQKGGADEKASGKVLGKSDRKYVTGLKLTLDNFNKSNLRQVPYFAITVTAPQDGYYPITANMAGDGRLPRSTVGVLVDGKLNVVRYARTNKTTDGAKVDTLLYLTAGDHVITFTTPIPATAAEASDYSYYWSNYDYVTLYDGLTLAKKQKTPTTEPVYTKVEAEEVAMFNLNDNNGHAVGNGYYRTAQTIREMMAEGIDGSKTPYAQFTVHAEQAGSYVLYLGVAAGMTEGSTQKEVNAQFMVEVNGKQGIARVLAKKSTNYTIVPVWIVLQEGENIIKLTNLCQDCQRGGTTWIDFDYIEMPYWVSQKLVFTAPGDRLEAEKAKYDGYAEMNSNSYSGGRYLGRANYDTVEELDITYDTLDPADMGGLPHVTYHVFTEKAGTYLFSVGFCAGLTNYPAEEIAAGVNGSLAVVVNGESKQRVEFTLKSASKNMARLITVELKEGENEITVTGTTSEYVIDRKPRNDETYRLLWIDQDYLALPAGVTSMSMNEEFINIDDTDFDFGQLILKDKTEQNAEDTEAVPQPQKTPVFLWILAAAGLIFLLIIIVLLKKRKKDEKKA